MIVVESICLLAYVTLDYYVCYLKMWDKERDLEKILLGLSTFPDLSHSLHGFYHHQGS